MKSLLNKIFAIATIFDPGFKSKFFDADWLKVVIFPLKTKAVGNEHTDEPDLMTDESEDRFEIKFRKI